MKQFTARFLSSILLILAVYAGLKSVVAEHEGGKKIHVFHPKFFTLYNIDESNIAWNNIEGVTKEEKRAAHAGSFADVEPNNFDVLVIPIGDGIHWVQVTVVMKEELIVLKDSQSFDDYPEAFRIDFETERQRQHFESCTTVRELLASKGCEEFCIKIVKESYYQKLGI